MFVSGARSRPRVRQPWTVFIPSDQHFQVDSGRIIRKQNRGLKGPVRDPVGFDYRLAVTG